MANHKSPWNVRLTTDIKTAEAPVALEELGDEQSFVIAILGDFCGCIQHASDRLTKRRFHDIDRDNFDEVLARLKVQWKGELGNLPGQDDLKMPVQLTFRELEDFHPDRVVEQIRPLRALIKTRQALEDPIRFETVATEVMKWANSPPITAADKKQTPVAPLPRLDTTPSELLDLILEPRAPQPLAKESDVGDLQRFLEEVVAPYLVRVDIAKQNELIGAVDAALAQQIRSVLHHCAFQHLEAAWRSLKWLVNHVEPDTRLKICILQLTWDELKQDLNTDAPLEESGLARLLLDRGSPAENQPVTLLIGNYEFSHALDDLGLLKRLGSIGQRLGAPFVAAASPVLLGCESFLKISAPGELERRFQEPAYQDWNDLRQSPQAHWLALALPRVLCRLPYGSNTEPTETFGFEELGGGCAHEKFLWGNPAFVVGAIIADAFSAEGWSLDLSRGVHRLEDFPLYTYREEETDVTKPCAEVLLTERSLEVVEGAGLVPLVSYRNTDAVVLPCLQTLGEPRSPMGWA